MSACLAARNTENPDQRAPSTVRVHAEMLLMEAPMKDDENASSTKGKARRALYPKRPNEVARLESLHSPHRARIKEEPEEGRRKTEIWHIFEAW